MSSGFVLAAQGLHRSVRNLTLTPCGIMECFGKHSQDHGPDRFACNVARSARTWRDANPCLRVASVRARAWGALRCREAVHGARGYGKPRLPAGFRSQE